MFFKRAFISKKLRFKKGSDKIYTLQSARTIDAYNPHCHLPSLP